LVAGEYVVLAYILIRHIEAPSNDTLLVEVCDQGVGVSEEMRGKLFRPFAQAQRRAVGTGLGLYSLALRVQALNGNYGVRAISGEGLHHSAYSRQN
jgi:signal transduction histidine kinase